MSINLNISEIAIITGDNKFKDLNEYIITLWKKNFPPFAGIVPTAMLIVIRHSIIYYIYLALHQSKFIQTKNIEI